MVNWQCFSMCPQNWGLHPNGNFSEENYHEPSDLGFSNKLSSLQAESPWTGKNFDCGSHGPFPRFTYRKWWCSRSMLVYPRVITFFPRKPQPRGWICLQGSGRTGQGEAVLLDLVETDSHVLNSDDGFQVFDLFWCENHVIICHNHPQVPWNAIISGEEPHDSRGISQFLVPL